MERVESRKAGFPPFPHLLEIPAGFPHFHGYGDGDGDDDPVSEDRQRPPDGGIFAARIDGAGDPE